MTGHDPLFRQSPAISIAFGIVRKLSSLPEPLEFKNKWFCGRYADLQGSRSIIKRCDLECSRFGSDEIRTKIESFGKYSGKLGRFDLTNTNGARTFQKLVDIDAWQRRDCNCKRRCRD